MSNLCYYFVSFCVNSHQQATPYFPASNSVDKNSNVSLTRPLFQSKYNTTLCNRNEMAMYIELSFLVTIVMVGEIRGRLDCPVTSTREDLLRANQQAVEAYTINVLHITIHKRTTYFNKLAEEAVGIINNGGRLSLDIMKLCISSEGLLGGKL